MFDVVFLVQGNLIMIVMLTGNLLWTSFEQAVLSKTDQS